MIDLTVEPIVRVRNLQKSYGGLQVLRGIDLDISPNQHVAIIGPSGSGKSTLLRLMMTLDKPDDGTIEIEGEHLWHEQRNGRLVPASSPHIRRVRSKVGMVFQHFNLFPHRTVLKNLTDAPRCVLKLSRDEADARALELLDRVGLVDKAHAYPGQLSGGQKQRVAIARALAMQPNVMLFDEVTSALDPELVSEVQSTLRDLATQTRMTMLLVTHQLYFAREIADRIIFFDQGRIIEDGTPTQLLDDPRHERTRQFLGAISDRSLVATSSIRGEGQTQKCES
jgi:polar amino acid transport system ATP-binding protein